jgi:transcriptional regulator with XRE-family HTH domain
MLAPVVIAISKSSMADVKMKKTKRKSASPRSANAIDAYIGARMRERRLALNISQNQLGKELAVSLQQIQKYESGENRVSAARLFDICKAFNVSLSSMFERDRGDSSSASFASASSDLSIERDFGGIACDATRIGLSRRVMIGRRAFGMMLRNLARECG